MPTVLMLIHDLADAIAIGGHEQIADALAALRERVGAAAAATIAEGLARDVAAAVGSGAHRSHSEVWSVGGQAARNGPPR